MFLPKGKLVFLLAQTQVYFQQEHQNNKFILMLLGRKVSDRNNKFILMLLGRKASDR